MSDVITHIPTALSYINILFWTIQHMFVNTERVLNADCELDHEIMVNDVTMKGLPLLGGAERIYRNSKTGIKG